MSETPHEVRHDVRDDPPPFLGAWNRVYTAVLIYLAFIIALLFAFSRSAAK